MRRSLSVSVAAVAVLFSAISLYADDAAKSSPMVGWLCNTSCVKQDSGHASCDQSCAEKNGDIVLIDEQGRVLKIANQEKVTPQVGKKVKMMCRPVPGKKDTMYVDTVSLYGG